jgi:symplekin
LTKRKQKNRHGLLANAYKRNENAPMAARIKQHADRINQQRLEIFDEGGRKRGLPQEPIDGLDGAKRVRLDAEADADSRFPLLPPGPVTVAQLYTLTGEEALKSFDVASLPADLVLRITIPLLQRVEQDLLGEAIDAIRARYLSVEQSAQAVARSHSASASGYGPDDDDDEYEPDFEPIEDREQVLNAMDGLSREGALQTQVSLALGPFKLPQPPPLAREEAEQLGKRAIGRVFSMISTNGEMAKAPRLGLNRLAGSSYDREAWITVVTRLATRASVGLRGDPEREDQKGQNGIVARVGGHSLGDGIRETLWKYVVEDFRARIPIAISWLNEEWYNDRITDMECAKKADNEGAGRQNTYETWLLKLLDAIIPYLDAKDKLLIRFLSEIPGIDQAVLDRVKAMARDPDRVTLAVNAIQWVLTRVLSAI